MKVTLKEYSNAVKEIIRGEPTMETLEFVKKLPLGKNKNTFGFLLNGKTIKILSPLRSFPEAYRSARRMVQHKDYSLSLRVKEDGKTKTISKRYPIDTPVEKAKKDLIEGRKIERIFYEILTTDNFDITYSEYEGTIIKFENKELARRCFHTIMGLFPFTEPEKENNKVKVDCLFDIRKDDVYGKDEKKRGKLNCTIYIDGETKGTKSNAFVF